MSQASVDDGAVYLDPSAPWAPGTWPTDSLFSDPATSIVSKRSAPRESMTGGARPSGSTSGGFNLLDFLFGDGSSSSRTPDFSSSFRRGQSYYDARAVARAWDPRALAAPYEESSRDISALSRGFRSDVEAAYSGAASGIRAAFQQGIPIVVQTTDPAFQIQQRSIFSGSIPGVGYSGEEAPKRKSIFSSPVLILVVAGIGWVAWKKFKSPKK